MKVKKILKIISGIIVFLTLPTLLLYAFLYFKYNEDLPVGTEGKDADILATKMLNTLNYDAYKATDYIEWTFKKRHHFKWNKTENTCEVYWKNYKINLDLNDNSKSEAFKSKQKIEGEDAKKSIQKALNYFNNDSFWLVAPYKVFDTGVKRSLVTLKNNEKALLVTYATGGSTPGDSYLWQFDATGKPKSFKMWTSILPIDGLEATWSDWITTETGMQLPNFHKLMVLGMEIDGIKTTPENKTTYYYPNREFYKNLKDKIDVNLDDFISFKQALDTIKNINCTNKTPVILYNNTNSNFKLILPYLRCDTSIGCYKCRNVLELKKDSLLYCDKRLIIDSLPKYLERHLLNNGKNPMYSDNINKAFFQIGSLNTNSSITDLKKILVQVSEEYNQINKKHEDSLFLGIQLVDRLTNDVSIQK